MNETWRNKAEKWFRDLIIFCLFIPYAMLVKWTNEDND